MRDRFGDREDVHQARAGAQAEALAQREPGRRHQLAQRNRGRAGERRAGLREVGGAAERRDAHQVAALERIELRQARLELRQVPGRGVVRLRRALSIEKGDHEVHAAGQPPGGVALPVPALEGGGEEHAAAELAAQLAQRCGVAGELEGAGNVEVDAERAEPARLGGEQELARRRRQPLTHRFPVELTGRPGAGDHQRHGRARRERADGLGAEDGPAVLPLEARRRDEQLTDVGPAQPRHGGRVERRARRHPGRGAGLPDRPPPVAPTAGAGRGGERGGYEPSPAARGAAS